VKKTLKKMALSALRAAGGFSLAANSSRRNSKLLILCYHGISLEDEHLWDALYFPPEQLRQRFEALKSFGANVLPLEEGIERLRTGSLPPRSVAITFDDGFYDFHSAAVPLLKEFGFPCTLYLTTYYMQHRVPIFNLAVSYLFWKSGLQTVHLPEFDDNPMPLATEADRHRATDKVLQWAASRDLTTPQKNEIAHQLAERVNVDYPAMLRSRILQIMSPEEAVATGKAGIDLQLHTHRHRVPRDQDLFQLEIRENRERIRDLSGRDATHFCYPSGDYDSKMFPWLRDEGVISATTCELGLASRSSDMLKIPRVLDCNQMNWLDFESWLCGVRV
jgi:peptidoglycan/xylan/chitin deacetylase (PgdA/CDA1 family)